MARTNAAAVKLVLIEGKQYDNTNSPDLTPFIDTATDVVDEVATLATAKGKTLSTTRLELIERWLAAHFYCQADPHTQSEGRGKANATFMGQTGMGLENSRFGQMALTLDSSGSLRGMGKGRVQFKWSGKPKSQQIKYENRD